MMSVRQGGDDVDRGSVYDRSVDDRGWVVSSGLVDNGVETEK